MKNRIYAYVGLALVLGLIGGYILTQTKNQNAVMNTSGFGRDAGQSQNLAPNRGNCLADDCLLVDDLEYPAGELSVDAKKALDEAINDEYKALSTYETVIAKFGAVRPFSMIKGAEEQHIASLKAVYDKYGLTVPENTWANQVTTPTSLQEACQVGVDAEIANAKLYKDQLLPMVKDYDDIVSVFTNLMNASEQKHLPAFERCN